jgi:hypothetical protein
MHASKRSLARFTDPAWGSNGIYDQRLGHGLSLGCERLREFPRLARSRSRMIIFRPTPVA